MIKTTIIINTSILKFLSLALLLTCAFLSGNAQNKTDTTGFNQEGEAKINLTGQLIQVTWPVKEGESGQLIFNLEKGKPLFKSIGINTLTEYQEITTNLDPGFILTVGKRDLTKKSGWDIFFDKVPLKAYQSYRINHIKENASIISKGSRTIIKIPGLSASTFKGFLEVTLYHGSPLFNVAAVMTTDVDSTAIVYDAGLISKVPAWEQLSWSDTQDKLQTIHVNSLDSAKNLAVKYRTIIGESSKGSLAIFPAPHQYFYPLDEAFNLKFVWHGNNYRDLLSGYGMGIRQELEGDKRYVPWFNSPPKTLQRLNFYCLLDKGKAQNILTDVKKYTHNDTYKSLSGYKTMASHFHNEFIMKVVLAGKPIPEKPSFVDVFKNTGIDIVHLAEFHYTAHPKGPDGQRLKELNALFEQCERLSDKDFLLLPGEEPNEFFGGHWLQLFPKPVYWIMSREKDKPFLTNDPKYGKIYRINNQDEMLKLLELENGLAWTAHARTKGSTGFPDAYKNEPFFLSNQFFGAAWKPIPGDLSEPRLGKRALDLLDDMNNWGLKKHMIGEADLFTIEPENEMYAHLNVNYLQMDKLPEFKKGWQPVLNTMKEGKFFTTTGEILFPFFNVNGKGAGETVKLNASGDVSIALHTNWTFPLNFALIISGDGKNVYHDRIDLSNTKAFGDKEFEFTLNLKGRTWIRVEVWDEASNGAYTQSVWLE